MNPLDWFDRIMLVATGNHGGFIYVSFGCLVAMWVAARLTSRRLAKLEKELAACTAKHEASDAQMGNLKMSLSALFTYAMLSGDQRVAGLQLPDLLDGRVALKIVHPGENDRLKP